MTQGAMTGFKDKTIDGYDFDTTFDTLAATYRGEREFGPVVEPLINVDAQLAFLPNSNVGVLNAKYIIESFVIPNMPNSDAFIDDFEGYSGTVSSSVATVQRAIDHLSRSFKVR